MKFQFNLSPQTHDVGEMNVFISYRTCDWDVANAIATAIQERGFDVCVFEPLDPEIIKPEKEVRSMLQESLGKADYICFINTFDALSSEWVAYEFVVAARTLGRVLFINTGPPISGFVSAEKLNELGKGFAMNTLYVKHTTIQLSDFKKDSIDILISEMMNDPDCGWVVGDQNSDFEHFPPSNELKRHSLLTKETRRLILEDPQFQGHFIVEIIPDEMPLNPASASQLEVERQFRLLLSERGMIDLLEDYDSGKVFVSRVSYKADSGPQGSGDLHAFVVREHQETRLGVVDELPEFVTSFVNQLFSELKQTNKIQVFEGQRQTASGEDFSPDDKTYTDPRDEHSYRIVSVLGKSWFAENLRFESRESCYYDNNTGNAKQYGCLYTWEDALRSVPPGWRLPTFQEWTELATHFGGLAANISGETGDATESFDALIDGGTSGIDIVLGGFRYYDSTFKYLDVDGYYWSTTEANQHSAYILYFKGGAGETACGTAFKIAAHSVRCVRNHSS